MRARQPCSAWHAAALQRVLAGERVPAAQALQAGALQARMRWEDLLVARRYQAANPNPNPALTLTLTLTLTLSLTLTLTLTLTQPGGVQGAAALRALRRRLGSLAALRWA